ncbi:MAG: iron-containing alcohol dehydrogenase [Clostridia bacterium]|nr:iron-containing alcohol dehydrogenase [Clostridia bacterium]
MPEIMNIIKELSGECSSCGLAHHTTIQDIQIAKGLVNSVGEILKKNNFPTKLLMVADQNTLKATEGIAKSLFGFETMIKVFNNLRVAEMEHVERLEGLVCDKDIAILSVGTGSINDVCRLAAARQNKKLCIFATAPSMDGFASYSSPIVANGFKMSYPAKSPEVIIADTTILAKAPTALKSAGFGDMLAKYVGLADWEISHILTGEIYCERVAELTRSAVDELMQMADKVTVDDEETAGKIFEALLKTGVGMSFMQNSRPASGSEHIISHLIECIELIDGKIPNYHGEDIGVCTLETIKIYKKYGEMQKISAQKERVDWADVFEFYGPMRDDVVSMNFPDNIIDGVSPDVLEEKWGEIVEILKKIPSFEECKNAMEKAGCKITVADIGKDEKLFEDCVKYSPFMRRRLTLLRLRGMIKNI